MNLQDQRRNPIPYISTESLILMCLINAMEGCKVVTCDVPSAFMQADIDKILHLKLVGEIAELLCWTVSTRVLSRTPSARDCHKPGRQKGRI